jgi:hypothetical protein
LDSQRVKSLTDGYLRGWLTFTYPNRSSTLREELILNHLEQEYLFTLLSQKLVVDTILIGGLPHRSKEAIALIADTQRSLAGLKLPAAIPKDTIKDEAASLSPENLEEWRSWLVEASAEHKSKAS